MYTQCPECATAFRVTADVLRQASGRVRCGNCSHTFNALAYLSEKRPESRQRAPVPAHVPELTPEPPRPGAAEARPLLSPTPSDALLATLEKLAADKRQLEDTGVQWRLLDARNDRAPNDDTGYPAAEEMIPSGEAVAPGRPEADVIEISFRGPELSGDSAAAGDAASVAEAGDAGDDFANEIFADTNAPVDRVVLRAARTTAVSSTPRSEVDELLDDAPTPVDELLTDSPGAVEAAEVFAGTGAAEVEAQDVFAAPETRPEDVLRFDDNTGLPDNFDFDAPSAAPSDLAVRPEPAPAPDAPPVPDIVFGDPDEWGDLLHEVEPVPAAEPAPQRVVFADTGAHIALGEDGRGAAARRPLTLAEELAALPEEDDDEPGEPETGDTGTSRSSAARLALELSGIYAVPAPAEATAATGDGPLDNAAGDGGHAADAGSGPGPRPGLLKRLARAGRAPGAAAASDAGAEAREAGGEVPEAAADWLRFLEDDAADAGPAPAAAAAPDSANWRAALGLDADAVLKSTGEDAVLLAPAPADWTLALVEEADEPASGADDTRGGIDDDGDEAPAARAEVAALPAARTGTARPRRPAERSSRPARDAVPSSTGELEFQLAEARRLDPDEPEFDPTRTIVPPPTEEEQTVNLLIDQDLMRLALTDDDGMTSTMVLAEKARKLAADGAEGIDAWAPAGGGALFETIIMEGAFARTALEEERLAAEARARAPGDGGTGFAARGSGQTAQSGRRRRLQYGLIACAVALVLLLAGQLVHQSRADLATLPAVADAIAPLYEAVGAPITPDWNVRAWRFEVTRGTTRGDTGGASAGQTASGEEVLTIRSRIGNTGTEPLPYPLLTVALTDRFEEVIGSRVLEPAEYLEDGSAIGTLVAPGETFEAVIAVATPADDAAGFKLNACYRESGGHLRCALEDFR